MSIAEGPTVGIDLGTSYSAIAYLNQAGQPIILENAIGSPVTRSLVLFTPDGAAHVDPHPELLAKWPSRAVQAIKRQMGNTEYRAKVGDDEHTPEFVSALILKKLKQDAERKIGPVSNAVITVPYYFNDACRRATRNAGLIAGLNVIDLINEPTAATLTYAWTKGELGVSSADQSPKTVMVYDLGGGTFDVTLVRYTPLSFEVIVTDGDTFLGGIDWTRRIVDFVSEQFAEKHGIDPREDEAFTVCLTETCEEAKRKLSSRGQTTMSMTYKGKPHSCTITRERFEAITADLLQRTRDTTELVLDHAGIGYNEVDEILLVGGSTRMTAVGKMLRSVCGRVPSRELNPQLAVARGAAIHAGMLHSHTDANSHMHDVVVDRLQSFSSTDVNSHSLGVEITDPKNASLKKNHIMIPRNSALPCEFRQQFVTNVPNPRGIHIRLLEGEASETDACAALGDLRIVNLPPNLPAGSPVEIIYQFDANRRVHVTARELTGNRAASVEIFWSGDMDSADLSKLAALAAEYKVY